MTKRSKAFHPLDVEAGSNVRLRRQIMKMSQEKLGDQLDITFQQIQKYENGANRMGVSRFCQIAEVLGVHPSKLLPHCDHSSEGASPVLKLSPKATRLAHLYDNIQDKEQKRIFDSLIKSFEELHMRNAGVNNHEKKEG